MSRSSAAYVCAAVLLIATAACTPRDTGSTSAELRPVALPDLSRLPDAVQKQLRDQFSVLTEKQASGSSAERADAYGRMGMLFFAAEYFSNAEAALLDAQTLAPSELRWPYYLGHIYRKRGDVARATAAFERATQNEARYIPAMVHLANAYLDQGKPDAAEALYTKVLMQEPRTVSALFGHGRSALARRDYATAIADFERALQTDPQAKAVHYPLAMAYRGAGQLEKAQAHLTPDNRGEIEPPDPLLEEVSALIDSPTAYEVRGERALRAGQWESAAQLLTRGVDLAPNDANLRHKLGTALAMKGDRQGALEAFEASARVSPAFVKARYSLGLLYAEAGQLARAEQEWATAVRTDPTYVEARLQLAELLRHTGREAAALPHYEAVVALDPRMPEALYGEAMTLVRLRRYAAARDRLADGAQQLPEQVGFAIALARVLAAAPDDRVRDGRRALQLLQSVPDQQRSLDWATATAMALAETGQFDEAIRLQRDAIAATSSDRALANRLTDTLRLYERKRPCRTPWSDGDAMDLVAQPAA